MSSNKLVSLRGVRINQTLLDELLGAVVHKGEVSVPLSMTAAELDARLSLREVTFKRDVSFEGATILRPLSFEKCVFEHFISLSHTIFDDAALSFIGSTFQSDFDLSFSQAERVSIGFTACNFERSLRAQGITVGLVLEDCRVLGDASLRGANAQGVRLDRSIFEGELDVKDLHSHKFYASGIQALGAHRLGPFKVAGKCVLTRAQFPGRIRLEVQAKELLLDGAQFEDGGHLVIDADRIDLTQFRCSRPVQVVGIINRKPKPSIVSLQNSDAGLMSFSDVNMALCVFSGAHDLARMTIDSTVEFSMTRCPNFRRRFIADEIAARNAPGMNPPERWQPLVIGVTSKPTSKFEVAASAIPQTQLPSLTPVQVSTIYRDLRKGCEARSDYSGAADFYYGEMEMRLRSSETGLPDRVILRLYWAVSGYGLVALRSVVAFMLLVFAAGTGLAYFGFCDQAPLTDGILLALRAAVPGVRKPSNVTLTPLGECVEVFLALVGPIVLGLGALAVRNRIRR